MIHMEMHLETNYGKQARTKLGLFVGCCTSRNECLANTDLYKRDMDDDVAGTAPCTEQDVKQFLFRLQCPS